MNARSQFFKIFILLFSFTLWSSFAPGPPSDTHTIIIQDMKFDPDELLVKKGDKVKFINQDMVIHNVTEENKSWASPTLAPKSSWTLEVKRNLKYYCSFHPMMKGKLIVKEK